MTVNKAGLQPSLYLAYEDRQHYIGYSAYLKGDRKVAVRKRRKENTWRQTSLFSDLRASKQND
jgi:hypothetical protein